MGSAATHTAAPSTIQRIAETLTRRFIQKNCTGVYSAEGWTPQLVLWLGCRSGCGSKTASVGRVLLGHGEKHIRRRNWNSWKDADREPERTPAIARTSFLSRQPVCNFVILDLRQDASRHQFAGLVIGTPRNHPACFCRGHPRQTQQLLFCGTVQIEWLVATPALAYPCRHSLGIALHLRSCFGGLLLQVLRVLWLSAACERGQQQNCRNVPISEELHFAPLLSACRESPVRNSGNSFSERPATPERFATAPLCSPPESSYLVFCSPAVSSCWSSAFCQLELGLYSFMALARTSVFLPRSF